MNNELINHDMQNDDVIYQTISLEKLGITEVYLTISLTLDDLNAMHPKKTMGTIGHSDVTIASDCLMYRWRHNRSTTVYVEMIYNIMIVIWLVRRIPRFDSQHIKFTYLYICSRIRTNLSAEGHLNIKLIVDDWLHGYNGWQATFPSIMDTKIRW